jgi:hypothetical protein
VPEEILTLPEVAQLPRGAEKWALAAADRIVAVKSALYRRVFEIAGDANAGQNRA